MSLDARIKVRRSERVTTRRRRRRHKRNVVERIWAYETVRELTDKLMQSTDNRPTAKDVMATVQQIASQVYRRSVHFHYCTVVTDYTVQYSIVQPHRALLTATVHIFLYLTVQMLWICWRQVGSRVSRVLSEIDETNGQPCPVRLFC